MLKWIANAPYEELLWKWRSTPELEWLKGEVGKSLKNTIAEKKKSLTDMQLKEIDKKQGYK